MPMYAGPINSMVCRSFDSFVPFPWNLPNHPLYCLPISLYLPLLKFWVNGLNSRCFDASDGHSFFTEEELSWGSESFASQSSSCFFTLLPSPLYYWRYVSPISGMVFLAYASLSPCATPNRWPEPPSCWL